MSEGELLQIKNSRKLKITEAEYFEIIRKKTATLISCCIPAVQNLLECQITSFNQMKQFGELLGIGISDKDDLLIIKLIA